MLISGFAVLNCWPVFEAMIWIKESCPHKTAITPFFSKRKGHEPEGNTGLVVRITPPIRLYIFYY
jgi:hypothetical protein